ncbi:MAG: hypothetical protein DRN14_00190 [Thermoplasmata archaeon]|nr:MAG: hypothetical protein DRN14_00190 [Thermoplasmata archaeon]
MIDFIQLCDDKGIAHMSEGHHHCHEGWVQVHCPFCSDGTEGWHLGWNEEHGAMNCWRCGRHTIWEYLHAVFLRVNIRELLQQYETGRPALTQKEQSPRPTFVDPPPNCDRLKLTHTKYLIERGFDPKKLRREWGLKGTAGLSGEWSWRIIAPIRDRMGQVVAYTGRALGKQMKPRWKTTSNEKMVQEPRQLIYGIEKVMESVLVVEGPSDVWRMGPGAVGVLGIDWTEEQASILRQFPRRYIMFDPQIQAQSRAQGLAEWLSPFPGVTEVIDGLKCDPGDLSQDEADNIMRELGF